MYIFPKYAWSSGYTCGDRSKKSAFFLSLGSPPLQIHALPPLPRFEGTFEAKADTADAWLVATTTIREDATAKIRMARDEIDKQRDQELSRINREFEETVRRATAARERGERLANDKHEALMRDSHTKYDLSDMDAKIAAVRVEGQEFRELAAVLRGPKPGDTVVESYTAAAPAPHAGGAATEKRVCIVCDDNAAELAIVPCGHVCLCAECCDTLLVVSPACPMCRGAIQSTLKVFLN